MQFESWFANTLGQSRGQVQRLLDDKNAIQFLIAWSIFESRCFEGYLKTSSIDDYAKIVSVEQGFKSVHLKAEIQHFYQRYQNERNLKNLLHKDPGTRLRKILKTDFGSVSDADFLYLCVYVVYRFRNNIFHGNKGVASWLAYEAEISKCIKIMQALISHAESLERRLLVHGESSEVASQETPPK